MPKLDDVVHEHIDILRVAEQDHYNKLNTTLQKAVKSRGEMWENMDELKARQSERRRSRVKKRWKKPCLTELAISATKSGPSGNNPERQSWQTNKYS